MVNVAAHDFEEAEQAVLEALAARMEADQALAPAWTLRARRIRRQSRTRYRGSWNPSLARTECQCRIA